MWCRSLQLHLKHQICSILGKRVQIRDKAIQVHVLYFIIRSYLHKFQTCKPPINREFFRVVCVYCSLVWFIFCIYCYSFRSQMLFCDFDRLILFMFSAGKIICPKHIIILTVRLHNQRFVCSFHFPGTISHILGKCDQVSLCIRSLYNHICINFVEFQYIHTGLGLGMAEGSG